VLEEPPYGRHGRRGEAQVVEAGRARLALDDAHRDPFTGTGGEGGEAQLGVGVAVDAMDGAVLGGAGAVGQHPGEDLQTGHALGTEGRRQAVQGDAGPGGLAAAEVEPVAIGDEVEVGQAGVEGTAQEGLNVGRGVAGGVAGGAGGVHGVSTMA